MAAQTRWSVSAGIFNANLNSDFDDYRCRRYGKNDSGLRDSLGIDMELALSRAVLLYIQASHNRQGGDVLVEMFHQSRGISRSSGLPRIHPHYFAGRLRSVPIAMYE